MTEPRRPRYTKRDANQQEIVDDLRRLGFYVLDLADVGGRVLDIFVCGPDVHWEWRWLAVEVKNSRAGSPSIKSGSSRRGLTYRR